MPSKRYVPPERLGHRWYLAEWAALRGKTQADAQRALGWPKSTISYLFNGTQRYTQNLVDEAARWLEIEPFEILMPPEDALSIRNIRESALRIAAQEEGRKFEHAPPIATPARRTQGRR